MKKSLFFAFVLAVTAICIISCKFDGGNNTDVQKVQTPSLKSKIPIENSEPVYILEQETYDPYVSLDSKCTDELFNDLPLITVEPTQTGLVITKSNNPDWWYIDIHVYNETLGIENPQIKTNESDNKDSVPDVYFYPFVKAGEEYKIYITKQEAYYTNWASTDNGYGSVKVIAAGGKGNFFVKSKTYSYKKASAAVTFKDLEITMPQSLYDSDSLDIAGGIYDGGAWTGNAMWPSGLELNDSELSIAPNSEIRDFINRSNILWVSLHYSYGYWDNTYSTWFSYERLIIEDMVYDASANDDKTILLEGGKKIPSVYINSSYGWNANATYHFNGDWVEATIRIDDSENSLPTTNILIRDRGNSTRWEGKTPFALKFPEKTKLLGMKKNKRWVLMANFFDRSLIRNRFIGYLGNNVFDSTWSPKFKPVNVYVNDRFIGTYDLGEQVKIGGNRVDIPDLEDYLSGSPDFNKDVNGDGKVDINDTGFILEIDMRNKQKYHFYSDVYKLPFNLKDPDLEEYSESQVAECFEYVKSKVNEFEKALKASDFGKTYKNYIDETSFVDWYLINEFAKNFDSIFQTSVYMYYDPKDGKLHMGPNWDYDLGLGNCNGAEATDGTTCDSPTGWLIHGGRKDIVGDNYELSNFAHELSGDNHYHAYWINRLFESSAFKSAVKSRWIEKRDYLENAINGKIKDYANSVYDYIPMNEANLPRLGQQSWNGPSGYAKRVDYEDEVYYLYSWCMDRYKWMDSKIKNGNFN